MGTRVEGRREGVGVPGPRRLRAPITISGNLGSGGRTTIIPTAIPAGPDRTDHRLAVSGALPKSTVGHRVRIGFPSQSFGSHTEWSTDRLGPHRVGIPPHFKLGVQRGPGQRRTRAVALNGPSRDIAPLSTIPDNPQSFPSRACGRAEGRASGRSRYVPSVVFALSCLRQGRGPSVRGRTQSLIELAAYDELPLDDPDCAQSSAPPQARWVIDFGSSPGAEVRRPCWPDGP